MAEKKQGDPVGIQTGAVIQTVFYYGDRYHKKYLIMETFDKFAVCGL